MEKHIASCSGQAGFNFTFDNGKIVDYQDNYRKIPSLYNAVSFFMMQKCTW